MLADPVANRPAGRAVLVFIIALAALVFLTGLGRLPLFGRDEALYAEAAREMQASGDWITPRVNGAFFFEKPPLLYWLTALSYCALGPTPLAVRLPVALIAILTIALIASLASRVWGRRAGLLAGVMLVTCPLIAVVGRMGIMDMPLTCLVTLALLAYARWRRTGGLASAAAFGLLVGLAFLLKGLAGGLAPAIALFHWIAYRGISSPLPLPRVGAGTDADGGGNRRTDRGGVFVGLALVVAAATASPWFIAMLSRHSDAFVNDFLITQHFARIARPMQGHGGADPLRYIAYLGYYPALIAFAFFPWAAFLPAGFRRAPDQDGEQAFWRSLAIVWFLVVLIPFSLIKTKLPGYIVPLFPPMAMLVAAELDSRLGAPPSRQPGLSPGRGAWIAVIVKAAILAALFAGLPLAASLSGIKRDVPNAGSVLQLPSLLWSGGYLVSLLGGVQGLRRRARSGLALMLIGQLIVVGAFILAMLPVLSPYLGGGPAYLAQTARRELPGRPIVLYETRPETVAFALRRSVPVYSRNQRRELLAEMAKGPTALIAPVSERAFWHSVPHGRTWTRGLAVLLEAHQLTPTVGENTTRDGSGDDEATSWR